MESSKKGIRIGPIPQMGGTSTTQQAIYLNHNNPCGINQFLYNLLGETNITYQQLADILSNGMSAEESVEAYKELKQIFFNFNENPTLQNQYKVYDIYRSYGLALWDIFQKLEIPGYKTHLTIYEDNGRTMFDSDFIPWKLVYESGGVLAPTQLQLVPAGNITVSITMPFPLPPLVINTTLNPTGANYCSLYDILKTPSFWSFILNVINPVSNQSQLEIIQSPFLVNQTQMFESFMAIASILTDTANTRTYSATKFGFSARPVLPGSGEIGYYCCYLQQIYSESGFLIESFFVRLGLERETT